MNSKRVDDIILCDTTHRNLSAKIDKKNNNWVIEDGWTEAFENMG